MVTKNMLISGKWKHWDKTLCQASNSSLTVCDVIKKQTLNYLTNPVKWCRCSCDVTALKDTAQLQKEAAEKGVEVEVERQDFRQVAVVKAFRHGADEILHLLTRVRDEEGSGGHTQ